MNIDSNATGRGDNSGKNTTGKTQAQDDKTGKDKTGKDKTGKDKTGKDKTGKDKTSTTGNEQAGPSSEALGLPKSIQVHKLLAEISMGEREWYDGMVLARALDPPNEERMKELATVRKELDIALRANLRDNRDLVARVRHIGYLTPEKIVVLLRADGMVPETVNDTEVSVEDISLLLYYRMETLFSVSLENGG